MNNSKPSPTVPSPSLSYQGAQLTIVEVDLRVGPFSFPAYPGFAFGLNMAETNDGVRQFELRPSRTKIPKDPPTAHFTMLYRQQGVAWDMVFRVFSDPQGGAVGTAFALQVDSNYPELRMSIAKTEVSQAGFGVLMRNKLPADYFATLEFSFWQNGQGDLPLDAWLAVETAYVEPQACGKQFPKPESIPMVPVGRSILYPAHQDSQGGVLGNNYLR